MKHYIFFMLLLCSQLSQSMVKDQRNRAIVIGASSGIGKELAKILSCHNYCVGLVARREELLKELQRELPNESFIKKIDINKPKKAIRLLKELIEEMGGLDLIIINSGISFIEEEINWQEQYQTIQTNITGFTALANVAINYFIDQKHGHIVGVSSIAGLRGMAFQPTYSASKAFVSTYLQGIRNRFSQTNLPIFVTDICPGFVDTPMVQHHIQNYIDKYSEEPTGIYWMAKPEEAAQQIYKAISNKSKIAYITKRWILIAWLFKIMPDWLYNKFS